MSKNLPIDILIEVEDHFITQILEIGDPDFENAFYKVKILWEKELSFPKYNIQFDLNDTTFFVRKITGNLLKETLKSSFLQSIGIFTLVLSFALVLSENAFGYFSLICLVIIYLSPIFIYFKNMKDFLLARQYDNYTLTYYQNHILVVAAGGGAFAQLLFRFRSETSHYIYSMIDGDFAWSGFWSIVGCAGLVFWAVFNVISQRKYLAQIKVVKPYLKYLHASS
ncbi:MAG: hypothetical protein EOO19_09340 [Chryseobacterium sp.]|nr:MAG: hypothetical protein EOO19_09340 [Chryseobacterium sp.]